MEDLLTQTTVHIYSFVKCIRASFEFVKLYNLYGNTSSERMNLSDYQKYFRLSYDQFIAQNNIQHNQVHEHLRYEKVTDATRVDVPGCQYFFFQQGTLKVIYISDDALAKTIWDAFKNSTSILPDDTVRSRAGKTSNQVIFAGQGITASVSKGEVDFIEIYSPCSLQDYLENIYQEPQPFIR